MKPKNDSLTHQTDYKTAGTNRKRLYSTLIDNVTLRFMRGLVSDDHVTSTGRNGQWKSREKDFVITHDSVSAAV